MQYCHYTVMLWKSPPIWAVTAAVKHCCHCRAMPLPLLSLCMAVSNVRQLCSCSLLIVACIRIIPSPLLCCCCHHLPLCHNTAKQCHYCCISFTLPWWFVTLLLQISACWLLFLFVNLETCRQAVLSFRNAAARDLVCIPLSNKQNEWETILNNDDNNNMVMLDVCEWTVLMIGVICLVCDT